MTTPGLGPVPAAGRGFQRFFRRWGSKANLRAVFNSVQPVAVVDRYFGDEEGSYQAITAVYTGQAGVPPQEFPAVIFGSREADVDVNIHKIGVWCGFSPQGAAPGVSIGRYVYLYTPILPYDPVLNIDPPGFYESGLITTPSFTRGTCIAIAGSNPLLPLGPIGGVNAMEGLTIGHGRRNVNIRNHFGTPGDEVSVPSVVTFPSDGREWTTFDPPLRLPDGITLAVQWAAEGSGFTAGVITQFWVTFLYTERRLAS